MERKHLSKGKFTINWKQYY